MMLSFSAIQRFLVILCSAFCCANSYADDTPIGQVIWVKAEVRAVQGKQPARLLQRRSPVYAHDIIETNATGSGEIAFTDSSVITLRPDTQVKIDDFHYQQGHPTESKSIMNVIKGGFRTITGVIPKENPDGYAVNTPVATIGVRGTEFSVYYDYAQGLLVDLNKGVVSVRNQTGTLLLDQTKGALFGSVKSVTAAPAILMQRPAIFMHQPPVEHIPAKIINAIPQAAPSKGKSVSNFCIG
jgi:hypothetical protein